MSDMGGADQDVPLEPMVFKDAAREQVTLMIAIAGPSGSGKTFSALRIAQGISPAGKIGFIDTEARRGLHYADKFKFKHLDMSPPFRPKRFTEAVAAAKAAGVEVVIIDSFSHEHDGIGGILEWADSSSTAGPAAWKAPKAAHKKMMNEFLQARIHIIFCLRAEEKIAIVPDPERKGKTKVESQGWMPICEKRFMYEMTASVTLPPGAGGVPDYSLPHKIQEQHRHLFPDGQPISEAAGRAMAIWAAGGDMPPPMTLAKYRMLVSDAVDGAETAIELGTWWNSPEQKQIRADLGMTPGEVTPLRDQVLAKVASLKSGPREPGDDAGDKGENDE